MQNLKSQDRLVLVTGATGFISRRLVKHLCELGFQVWALTRASMVVSDIQWVVGDVTKPETLTSVCEGVSYVFHLAGYAHAWEEENSDFAKTHQQVNLQGTLNLAIAAKSAGVKRFVFFSTIKAVADSEHCTDESWVEQPISAYGLAKRQAEEQLLALCLEGPMEAVILRPSLVYGIGWKGNLAAMLKAIDRDRFPPPPPYVNKKSMISIDDLVEIAILAAQAPRLQHYLFIVTDGIDYSTRQLYDGMRMALGKKPNRIYWPMWVWSGLGYLGEAMQRLLKKRLPINRQAVNKLFDNSCYRSLYLQSELGYTPRHTFESVLPDIVKGYKESKV